MGLRGNLNSIRGLKQRIQQMPTSVAHEVTQRAAPEMTRRTLDAFDGRRTVYGEARPQSVAGEPLTLVESGDTRKLLRFVANGTQLRVALGKPYIRYLIGKYGILPNGALPADWSQGLGRIVHGVRGLR